MALITLLCNIFSPGTGTYNSGQNLEANIILHLFYVQLTSKTYFVCFDRWQEFSCPLSWKEPDIRKSSDRKFGSFGFTPVYIINR